MIDDLIDDGDIILLKPAKSAEKGQKVAVWLKDEAATTLKRYYPEGNQIRLQPANKTMDPIITKSENVEIIFNEDALKEISEKAFIINSEIENIGARRLHTVMSKLLNEILFDIPEKIGPNAKIIITKNMVEEKLNAITQNKDLSEYIL